MEKEINEILEEFESNAGVESDISEKDRKLARESIIQLLEAIEHQAFNAGRETHNWGNIKYQTFEDYKNGRNNNNK